MRLLQTEEDNKNTTKCVLSVVILVFLKKIAFGFLATTELFQHKYQFGVKNFFVVQSRSLKTLVFQPSQKIKVLV